MKNTEIPTQGEITDLIAVYDMQAKGFAGLFTGRQWPKRHAEALRRKGCLRSSWMDVADGDGFAREGCKPRRGYSLTSKGLAAIPEDDKWAGDIEIDD